MLFVTPVLITVSLHSFCFTSLIVVRCGFSLFIPFTITQHNNRKCVCERNSNNTQRKWEMNSVREWERYGEWKSVELWCKTVAIASSDFALHATKCLSYLCSLPSLMSNVGCILSVFLLLLMFTRALPLCAPNICKSDIFAFETVCTLDITETLAFWLFPLLPNNKIFSLENI